MEKSSATSLVVKLGIRDESKVVLLRAPSSLALDIPAGVKLRRQSGGHADVVVAFISEVVELERRIATLSPMVFPSGGLWIAWPKKSSGVVTDMNDHAVRTVALPLGLVDNKVCAIDDTWTALRFVWRRGARSTIS